MDRCRRRAVDPELGERRRQRIRALGMTIRDISRMTKKACGTLYQGCRHGWHTTIPIETYLDLLEWLPSEIRNAWGDHCFIRYLSSENQIHPSKACHAKKE